MYRLCLALTLCMFGTLAFRIDYDLEDFKDWQYDSNDDKDCIKDIIIVLDTSRSVGRGAFNDAVKPFLKNLVTDVQLNVHQEGTRVGLIIFSSVGRTKKMLDIGQISDADKLGQYIVGLRWDDVQGGHTRTDLGLEMANEMFLDYTAQDPVNHRVQYGDVAIVITDGAPRGRGDRKDKEESIKWANAIKAQDALIIGIAVGRATVGPRKNELIGFIKELATSPEYVFVQEDLDDIDKIRGKLIADTCNVEPVECTCDSVEAMPVYLKEGESTVVLDLPDPTYTCEGGEAVDPVTKEIQPPLPVGNRFGVGVHTHNYKYTLNGGVILQCPITVDVRKHPCEGNKCNPKGGVCVDGNCVCKDGYGGPNCFVLKCRGQDFHSTAEVCCCGTVHPYKPGHKCCGPDYYNPNEGNCCDNANLIPGEKTCPNLD